MMEAGGESVRRGGESVSCIGSAERTNCRNSNQFRKYPPPDWGGMPLRLYTPARAT